MGGGGKGDEYVLGHREYLIRLSGCSGRLYRIFRKLTESLQSQLALAIIPARAP
jgi:hypothetical protein